MIHFLYRKNDPYLSVAPLRIFQESFSRYDDRVEYIEYSLARQDSILRRISPGDAVYLYNMGYRNRTSFAENIIKRGGAPINLPSFFGKHNSGKELIKNGIPTPRHRLSDDIVDIEEVIDDLGIPFIIKPVYGSGGKNVSIVESLEEVPDSIPTGFILQEYIPEASESIVRINIVDQKVVGSMVVRNTSNEKVCNLSIDALPAYYGASEEESRIAVEATRIIGLDISGVDMVQSSKGPMVLEVNSAPGFRGMPEIGIKFEDHIVDLIIKKHREFAPIV